jgi:hypothetical protein
MHAHRPSSAKRMRLGLVASLALFFRRASNAVKTSIAFRVPSMKMLAGRLSTHPSSARGRKVQASQQQQQQQQRRRQQQLSHSDAERPTSHDHGHSEARSKTDGPVLFEAGALKDWLDPQSAQHNGLLVKRPFCGAWDHLSSDVDKALLRFGRSAQLETEVKNGEAEELSNRLEASMASFVAKAGLPAELSKQIHIDACGLGNVVGSMCPFASVLEIKLEVHGENVCSRWHQDWYAGRV